MRLVLLASLGLAVSAFAQVQGDPLQPNLSSPKQAYKAFLRDTPGPWVAQWNSATVTPSAIYGNSSCTAGVRIRPC